MTEAFVLCELIKLGAPISYLDVGGRLGVDYDGTRSASDSSTNYGAEEYAQSIIQTVIQICGPRGSYTDNMMNQVEQLLLTVVLSQKSSDKLGRQAEYQFDGEEGADEYSLLKIFRALLRMLKENIISTYNQLTKIKKDSLNAFNLGLFHCGIELKLKLIFIRS